MLRHRNVFTNPPRFTSGVQLVLGVGASLTALGLNIAIAELLEPVVFPLFFLAVLLSAWLGGTQAAIACMAVSVVGFNYMAPPIYHFELSHREDFVRAGLFLLVSTLIIAIDYYRRSAQTQQRVSEDRWRSLVTNAPSFVGILGRDGTVLYANRGEGGLAPGDLVGRNIRSFLPEAYHEPYMTAIAAAFRGEVASLEVQAGDDGETSWYVSQLGPVYQGGKISGAIAISTEISTLRSVQKEAQDSAERLRLAMEAGRMGAWEWDIPGLRVKWSDDVARMHGMAPEDFGGSPAHFLRAVHPDDRERVQRELSESLSVGVSDIEYRVLTADGGVRWISARGRVVNDPGGTPIQMIGVCADITDRRLAQQALRDSEERNRAVLETAVDGIVVIGSDGIVRSLNPAACRIFGYQPQDVIGQNVNMLMPEPDKQRHESYISRYLETGEKKIIGIGREVTGLRRDGSTFPMELAISEMSIGGQRMFTNVVRDITARRQAEDAVRESEERFRTLADSAPVMVWLADPEQGRRFFNRAWLEFTGRTMEEEAGDGWMQGLHPDDRERSLEIYRAAFASREPFEKEYRLRRHDGEYRWVLSHGAPRFSPSGVFLGYVGSCIDIHDRHTREQRDRFLSQATATLAGSLDYEATLEALVRVIVPEQADFCVVDLAAGSSLQRAAVAAADRTLEATLWALAEQYPNRRMQERILEATRSGEAILIPQLTDEQLEALAVDDKHLAMIQSLHAVSGMLVPLVAHGETIGVLTLGTGESGRTFSDDDLVTMQDLAGRAALFIENARLYAAKDEFLGMVSHELRTPITTVYSGSRLLLSRYDQLADSVKRDVLRDIENESERLQLIVENLLALAREEMGQKVEPEPIPVQRAVEATLKRIGKLRPDRRFQVSMPQDARFVNGVPIYLDLVLRNIVDNADKYSPPNEPIEVRASSANGSIVLAVRDHGPGIRTSDVDRVFERFYRAGDVRKVSGTGIGLSVCKRLVESQGGTITARNCDDGGFEVAFALPAIEAEGD